MRRLFVLLLLIWPMAGIAQDSREETLADIRQSLSVLFVDIQTLKRELSTTGAASTGSGSTTLDRVNAIEAALTALTAKTEALELRINRIVDDGTRRIGDLEFRLVELEGGDVSQLGETSTLGGAVETPVAVAPPTTEQPDVEMAVGERADFERATQALADGDAESAAQAFQVFLETYPGSPMDAQARLGRGEALEALGQTREAARAYLDAFSGAPSGPVASDALFHLGKALGGLGQATEACVTLAEVGIRFPGAPAVAEAEAERAALNCP